MNDEEKFDKFLQYEEMLVNVAELHDELEMEFGGYDKPWTLQHLLAIMVSGEFVLPMKSPHSKLRPALEKVCASYKARSDIFKQSVERALNVLELAQEEKKLQKARAELAIKQKEIEDQAAAVEQKRNSQNKKQKTS